MSQDNNDKAKGTSTAGGKPGEAAKRPYATLDLKATEVARDKPSVPGSGSVPGTGAGSVGSAAPKPSDTVNPPAPASPTGSATPGVTAASTASAGPAQKDNAASKPADTAAKSSPPGSKFSAAASPSSPAASKSGPAVPARTSPSSPWIPSLVSGAAGALLTLLGLGSMGLIGGDGTSGAMAERMAALEKTLAAQPASEVAKSVAAADARLAAMEANARDMVQAQAALSAQAKALDTRLADPAAATAAADRVQKLEQQLADLAAAASNDPQRGRIPALAQITTKLGDLDTQITTRSSSLKAELSQELERRLAKSDETAEAARARLAQRTQSLEQTLKSVADDTTALRTSVDGLKGDLDTRFKAAAKPQDVAAAVEPVTARIAGLEKNLANVVRSEQDRNATAGNILLSIELGNLKRAIDRGGRFTPELAAVKKVGGDKLNLAVLEGAQASGVPSLAALTTEFRSLAYTMLDAEADPDQGSVVDRLLASAKSVVRVRKVVHSADDKGTEAIVGRMEADLREGRLAELLDQAKGLGAKPQAVAAPWLKKIEARHAIETALADLDQSLKNALAGSAAAPKAEQKGVN